MYKNLPLILTCLLIQVFGFQPKITKWSFTLFDPIFKTSQNQIKALIDLYEKTNGKYWTRKRNWLIGDPCLDLWEGIQCELFHQEFSITEM